METTQQMAFTLRNAIDKRLAISIEGIIYDQKRLGPISFEGARPDMEAFYSAIREIKDLPLEDLPRKVIAELQASFISVVGFLVEMKNLSVGGRNSMTRAISLVDDFTSAADNFLERTYQVIPYLNYRKAGIQEQIERASSAVKTAKVMMGNLDDMIAKKGKEAEVHLEEIKKIVQTVREVAANTGVQKYSANFAKAAGKAGRRARKWLLAMAAFAVATLVAPAVMSLLPQKIFFSSITNNGALNFAQILLSKAVILGLLITATFWCAKMYRAARHQQTVNQHRENALLTFQAFIEAAEDKDTRSAVLLETTKSIFTITPSGYLDQEQPQGGELKIVEMLRGATGEGS